MNSTEKGAKNYIVKSSSDERNFMNTLLKRTVLHLLEEFHIKITETSSLLHDVNNLILFNITSIITIEDCARMTVMFSYENQLIREIFKRYTENLEVDENETQAFIEETSSDMINIVVGNLLSDFEQPGIAFALSPPMVVNEAKNVIIHKNSNVYSGRICTEFGCMMVFCIMHGDMIYNQLSKTRSE